ncbi:DUF2752 domain-containing protein [Mycobacterium frederiksbergense]|uniref:DUF2752 domain-containing protein n=1 Tax=Mycolicibacterium frederiksbergense TaxID=117567 RepID=A0A6H0SDQ5_9MYCO|nr:DUF2752 domain-containing protein [Mycolicibacterium frederiksbergense]MCV7044533.1 DUF2752 domain-containing protein [Mycolicibacterium frederiksbergense]QIV84147.1 DUF2752 domain-containing protein [Mycolicibacterium frederiksbergense]
MAPESATTRAGLIGAGAAGAGALAYIGLADPHRPGFLFPGCPFKALTGLDCPACGGLRMTHDLLNGDLTAAVVDNVFLLVALPALAVWLVVRWRRGLTLMPMAATVTVVVAAVAWTVVRNWPGFPLVPTVLTG